jgi:hypothetical protein
MHRFARITTLVALGLGLGLGCAADDEDADDHGHGHDHNDETEVITTVTLTFTPTAGGDAVTASFRDPDGDGGMSGMSDAIVLAPDTEYQLQVSFLNELGTPAEDITEEVEAEAEDHQVFVSGDAVEGPGTAANPDAIVEHAYDDTDSSYGANTGDDLPVGLANLVTTRGAGAGELDLMLRHMPELNGAPQKVAGLADDLARGVALPGEVDVMVSFSVTVQ